MNEIENNVSPTPPNNFEEISSIETEGATQVDLNQKVKSDLESIYDSLQSAIPNNESIKSYSLPNARQWLGPRFISVWVLPIYLIKLLRRKSSEISIVKPYSDESNSFQIKGPETLHTSMIEVFKGKQRLKFFGPRFIAIWVLPFAITGIIMEFLFVSPMKNLNPFG
tara:strand:- start:3788 stop:4288 length:501 start_codon:yes stop_codon:yes gene_type:complete